MFRKFLRRHGALIFVPNSVADEEFDSINKVLNSVGMYLNYPMAVLGADDNKWKFIPITGNWFRRKPKQVEPPTPRPKPQGEKKNDGN